MTMKETSSTKATQTVREVSGLIKWWYGEGRKVKDRNGHIAWVMIGLPNQLLLAMDVFPIAPEQYSAACAAKQATLPFCEKAEVEGYNRYICGYCRVGLGYAARVQEEGGSAPPEAPYGGIARPDLLIGRTFCDAGYKWFQALRRHMRVPCFVFEQLWPVPDSGKFLEDKLTAQRYLSFYRRHLEELVAFLEQHTGRKLDYDRLREIIKISHETVKLCNEIFQLRKSIPSPLPTEDYMTCQFPLLTMLGTEAALGFFRKLHTEVKHRAENKISVPAKEDFRLLWQGIPPWHHTRIFNLVHEYNAVFTIESTYLPPELIELNLKDPLAYLAEVCYRGMVFTRGWPRRGEETHGPAAGYSIPGNVLLRLVKDFGIDGAVLHRVSSCHLIALGNLHAARLLKQFNVPTLIIESDMADTRGYSESEIAREVDAFMQIVKARKGI